MYRRFLTYLEVEKRYSARTVTLYRRSLAEYVSYALPERKEEDVLTSEELSEVFQLQLIRGYILHCSDRGLSARSINLRLSALSSCCSYLVRSGVLESNPVQKIPRPKESRRLPEFFPEASLKAYFDDRGLDGSGTASRDLPFHDYRNVILLLVLYATGMRRSEAVSLTTDDFDVSRSVFRILGKGNKFREIPVPPSVCQEILLYLKRIEREFPRRTGKNFFITDKGHGIYPEFVNEAVHEELDGTAGFSGKKSPHVLRHSLATHLLNNGAEISSIKEILGHASLAATQIYTHNSFEHLKKIYITAHPRAKNGGKNGY